MLCSPMYRFRAHSGLTPFMDLALRSLDELGRELTDTDTRSTVTREPTFSYRTDERVLHIRVELPGVAPADLHINAESDKISIKGTRFHHANKDSDATDADGSDENEAANNQNNEDSGNNAKHTQDTVDAGSESVKTPQVVFAKEFHLPRTIDASAATATFRDGLLDLVIPNKKASERRRITVNA